VDAKQLVATLREEHGVVISGGQQSLAGKIIRVGHLGWVTREDLDEVFQALRQVLPRVGGKVPVAAR
jgi:aspartate aminotransferase-like enzyme